MKAIFTLATLFLFCFGQAQLEIPNPSFEEWEIINSWNYTPVGWSTQNWQLMETTTMDSAACHEDLSMAVKPIGGFETSAGVAHVEIETDYIPANFSFCVKRYVDIAEDTVQVRLRFWNATLDPPFVVYENAWVTSDSDTSWNYINMPLDQIEPVMHYVTIEVIAGYNGPLGGGSHLTWISVDDMAFDMVDDVIETQDDYDLIVAGDMIRLSGDRAFQAQRLQIQLFDIRGKLVAETRENSLNFNHLRSGIYIATLLVDGQTVTTKRVFKQ